MNKIKKLMLVFGAVVAPLACFADAPLDMATTGTTLAGYIGTAATAALAIFAGLYGIRVIIRAFRSVK